MRQFGFIWGIGGVLAILLSAIYRLTPMVMEVTEHSLTLLQWGGLLLFVPYMAYAEGYKGFHRGFAPRVVVRANYLRQHSRPLLTLLAPLFCMGYFHATRRRMITSWILTSAIVLVVLLVRLLPQPWRGIIDAGVVTGLFLGSLSILYFAARMLLRPQSMDLSADLPEEG